MQFSSQSKWKPTLCTMKTMYKLNHIPIRFCKNCLAIVGVTLVLIRLGSTLALIRLVSGVGGSCELEPPWVTSPEGWAVGVVGSMETADKLCRRWPIMAAGTGAMAGLKSVTLWRRVTSTGIGWGVDGARRGNVGMSGTATMFRGGGVLVASRVDAHVFGIVGRLAERGSREEGMGEDTDVFQVSGWTSNGVIKEWVSTASLVPGKWGKSHNYF